MKTLLAILLGSLLAPSLSAQAPPGPTMEDTRAWLESDGRAMMHANRLQMDQIHRAILASEEHIETLTLSNCTLYWRTIRTSHSTVTNASGSHTSPDTTRTLDVTLALRDLSVGSISVQPDTLLTDAPIYVVRFVIRQQVGSSSTQSADSGNPDLIRGAGLPVETAEDGERIASAVKRATVLCGVAASGPF